MKRKMKNLNEYIFESKSSNIVNKIKKEILSNWSEDKVCIINKKFKFYTAYYIYVYDIESKEALRKLDNIIKDDIDIYNGMPDEKLNKKYEEIKELANKHKDAEGVMKYLYDIPAIFLGFTSNDLK